MLLAVQSVGASDSAYSSSTGSSSEESQLTKPKGPGSRGLLLQLDLTMSDSTVTSIVTDKSWSAWNADVMLNPSPGKNWYKHVLENTDATSEPVGWRDLVEFAGGESWSTPQLGKAASACSGLKPKIARPMQVVDVPAPTIQRFLFNGTQQTWYFVDFGREFQGGLRLQTSSGIAGQTVRIMASYPLPMGFLLSSSAFVPVSCALLCSSFAVFCRIVAYSAHLRTCECTPPRPRNVTLNINPFPEMMATVGWGVAGDDAPKEQD